MRYKKRLLLTLLSVVIGAQTTVYAYTDPGSGVLLWQILLAAFIGVMFYVRRIIAWARHLVNGRKVTPPDNPVAIEPAETTDPAGN